MSQVGEAQLGCSSGGWAEGATGRTDSTAHGNQNEKEVILIYAFNWDLVNKKDSSKALISINPS